VFHYKNLIRLHVAAPSDESYDSNSVFPVFKRVSPQTEAATPAKSTAVSTSVLSISDDSDGDEISPLVSPATSTPFSEVWRSC
jgi:hypothetical protein